MTEPRYIDINKLTARVPVISDGGGYLISTADLQTALSLAAAETGDVVEVVRCKDCTCYRNHPNGLCYAWTEPYDNERGYKGEVHCVDPDDFCSMGHRKETDNG